jgi:hypothetical protein
MMKFTIGLLVGVFLGFVCGYARGTKDMGVAVGNAAIATATVIRNYGQAMCYSGTVQWYPRSDGQCYADDTPKR